ncbi:MAG: tetratricopeptide repeat protein [Magnetococcales bacterium]|nr:tetratricopeptide repeat protein [Magnetococcales bacterium]
MSVLVDTLAGADGGDPDENSEKQQNIDTQRNNYQDSSSKSGFSSWGLIFVALLAVGVVIYATGVLSDKPAQDNVKKAETEKKIDLMPLSKFVRQESKRVRPIVPPNKVKAVTVAKEVEAVEEKEDGSDEDKQKNDLIDLLARMDLLETTINDINKSMAATKVQESSRAKVKPAQIKLASSDFFDSDESGIRQSRRLRTAGVRKQIERAKLLFGQGKIAKAHEIYQSVLRQDVFRREALMGLASIAVHKRQFDEARRTYKQILFLDPKDQEAKSRLLSLRETDDPIRRISQLKAMIREEPDNYNLHFILGTIYTANKKWSDARTAFYNAHILERDHPDTIYNLAISLDHLQKQEEALKYYILAAKLAVDHSSEFKLQQVKERIKELQNYLSQT